MPPRFKSLKPEDVTASPFRAIGQEWMLVTAGTTRNWNTMTASWGALGMLWNHPVAFAFVRPTRHTYSFMEKSRLFTLSFFPARFRKALLFCGTHSGRDTDKAKATGLIPFTPAPGAVAFEQARLILVCRKLYTTDINPGRFLDPRIDKLYPKKDYHRVYCGRIAKVLSR